MKEGDARLPKRMNDGPARLPKRIKLGLPLPEVAMDLNYHNLVYLEPYESKFEPENRNFAR